MKLHTVLVHIVKIIKSLIKKNLMLKVDLVSIIIRFEMFEQRLEKTCLWGFSPGSKHTGLYSHRQ